MAVTVNNALKGKREGSLVDNRFPSRQWLTKAKVANLASVVNGVNHTSHIQTVLEVPAGSLRIGIINSLPVGITNVKCMVGNAPTLGGENSAASIASDGFINATFSSATSVTLPAGVSQDDPSVTWTDWLRFNTLARTDGGAFSVIHVRVEIPLENANRPANVFFDPIFENEGSATVAPYGRPYRCRTQNVLAATWANRAAFTSTTTDNSVVPIVIQYVPNGFVTGKTLMLVGDSIFQQGIDSWSEKLQRNVSTPASPVEICNVAVSGSAPASFITRASRFMPGVKPEICIYPAWSVNQAFTPPINIGHIYTMKSSSSMFLKTCGENDVIPVFTTGMPSAGFQRNYGSSDSLRTDFVNEVKNANSSTIVIDTNSVMTGARLSNGQYEMLVGSTDDGLHPNTTLGHELIANLAQKELFPNAKRNMNI